MSSSPDFRETYEQMQRSIPESMRGRLPKIGHLTEVDPLFKRLFELRASVSSLRYREQTRVSSQRTVDACVQYQRDVMAAVVSGPVRLGSDTAASWANVSTAALHIAAHFASAPSLRLHAVALFSSDLTGQESVVIMGTDEQIQALNLLTDPNGMNRFDLSGHDRRVLHDSVPLAERLARQGVLKELHEGMTVDGREVSGVQLLSMQEVDYSRIRAQLFVQADLRGEIALSALPHGIVHQKLVDDFALSTNGAGLARPLAVRALGTRLLVLEHFGLPEETELDPLTYEDDNPDALFEEDYLVRWAATIGITHDVEPKELEACRDLYRETQSSYDSVRFDPASRRLQQELSNAAEAVRSAPPLPTLGDPNQLALV